MVALLDSSVLIAVAVPEHQFHAVARDWFIGARSFATCPITQGALVRFMVRYGLDGSDAARVLGSIIDRPEHVFWPDDVVYDAGLLSHVRGHGQVTDAYLLALARAHGGSVATFDRGLAEVDPAITELLAASD